MVAGRHPERVAPAQRTGTQYQDIYARSAPLEGTACLHAAPKTGLSDIGHVQPQNLTMVYRFVDAEGWAHAFPLDSVGRASRSLGGDPREVSTQTHARVHRRAIGQRSIKNHSASYDRPSLPRPASPKIGV